MGHRSAHDAWTGARSRVRRLREIRGRRRLVLTAVAALASLAVVAAVFALVSSSLDGGGAVRAAKLSAEVPLPTASLTSADGSSTVSEDDSGVAAAGVKVEVPNLVGKSVKVAEAVITGAGFASQTRVADPPVIGVSPDTVLEQWPAAGAIVQAGSPIVVTYQPRAGVGATDSAPVVVIDAGHQQTANLELEPIGPGSQTSKPKVAGGATGVATLAPEYRRTLEIALKLKAALVAKGVKVVMVRTTHDVDIANSERAKIGNSEKADLVIRVHCDTSPDTAKQGVSTLYPSGNSWVAGIEKPSLAAAGAVQSALVRATGARSVGTFGRGDMSGFNYSTRPVVMVLCGFMSNAAEDRKLGDAGYQTKVASGIANGVAEYLSAR